MRYKLIYIAILASVLFLPIVQLSAQDITASGDVKINMSGTVKMRLSGDNSAFNLIGSADFVDAANTALILEGNLDSQISLFSLQGNLLFEGSTIQSFFGANASLENLTVSNNEALLISGSVFINRQLNFEQSRIFAVSGDLTLDEGITISGAGSSGFVDGPLRVRANGTSGNILDFPIGKGSDYLPLRLRIDQTGSSGFYVAEAFNSNIPTNSLDATLASVSTAKYWSVTSSETISNSYIELPVSSNDGVSSTSLARVAKEENGNWVDLGGINLTTIPGTIRSSVSFSNLGNFIIANAKSGNTTPSITSITPNSGKIGDVVTITGSNLGNTNGTIKFGNVTVSNSDIISWTDNQIQVKVPAGVTAGNTVNLEITVNGASTPIDFTFTFEVTEGTTDCNDFSIATFPKNTADITVGQAKTFIAEVSDATLVSTAEFYYRGISQETWLGPFNASNNGNDFSYELDAISNVSEIGLEYYFVFKFDGCSDVQTGVQHAYFYFPSGVNITGLSSGNTAGDYNLFSLPLDLDNKSVSSTLDELGQYDKSKWRLFRIQNNAYQEFSGSNFTIEPGRGYLLIFDVSTNFSSSAGSTVNVTKENPFRMSLQRGWNMISTPYPFTIQWEDVLTANGFSALTDFFYYTSTGYVAGNGELNLFEGAIWFSENATTIDVPVLNDNSGGRIAAGKGINETFNENNWELALVLNDDNGNNLTGGIGMKENALLSKDEFDGMRPPASTFQSSFHFTHEEYFYPYFLKDIVPNANNYEWEFEVSPANKSNSLKLNWDNDLINNLGFQLYLVETNTGFTVDMSQVNSYSFPASNNKFKIVLGNSNSIESGNSIIGEVYPNPALDLVKLPVSFPINSDSRKVKVEVYSTTGKKILTTQNEQMMGGYQEIELPLPKSSFSKGVYLVKVQLESDSLIKKKNLKLVIE